MKKLSLSLIIIIISISLVSCTNSDMTNSGGKNPPNMQNSNKVITSNNNLDNTSNISLERAKEIALEHAGLDSDEVTFIKLNKEFDDGIQKYEIEFYSNGKEYDYEINAYNGQIIKYDYDMENNYTPNNNLINDQSNIGSTTNISLERAKEIALQNAGLESNQVSFKKVKLDIDDGIQKYEVEFYSNGKEYDYEIDANSGDIISYEIE